MKVTKERHGSERDWGGGSNLVGFLTRKRPLVRLLKGRGMRRISHEKLKGSVRMPKRRRGSGDSANMSTTDPASFLKDCLRPTALPRNLKQIMEKKMAGH